ncbi:hypothetical protein, partial [Flavobacterium suzhouense]
SVHPEPGSNSSSYILIFLRSLLLGHVFFMISEYFLLSLMLSIQYVYERFLLVFFASELSFSKRLQKYNFFSSTQAFLKKNFFLKNSADSEFQKLFQHPDLSVWEGKDKIFFLLLPSFFQNFFFSYFLLLHIR